MTSLADRLGQALAEKREGTQADLARACGVSTASVSNWFTGKTLTLKGSSLVSAARYLGVNSHWLETGKGPMRSDGAALADVAQAGSEWPFELVSVEDWWRLPPPERTRVEGFILGLLATIRSIKRGTGT